MTEFRYHYGAVYIFENFKAQRVKVGMTISKVSDRLNDVNDMWSERKVTCQICGGRLVNTLGLVPQHVVSGKRCTGGNKLPLEKDVTLAETYQENIKNSLCKLSGSEKGSATRIINTLDKRIKKYLIYTPPEGKWELKVVFHTECAEKIELLSHEFLKDYLDKGAPFGEVFSCSVSTAIEAIEKVLSQLELLDSVRKETHVRY